ncbi:MAG: rubrerythrin family protein [Proteobacteria bacterium]|nr:rubrerythrin family protein [Desulfobacula sp.]MBU3950618.1 rubrerythrin family protein [Pseudomonadota bacterium]MBU4132066.1 rubrerythrin family protein [Pseudomonadota bacterium]
MGKFRESQTAINLHTSFAAEAQARTRYNFFANKAREEGFIQIAKIFDETADQECEHALRFFKFFNGGELPINWSFPTGVIEATHANLLSSAELERYVSFDMYAKFAKIAQDEGYQRAADTFYAIIVSERHHEKLFLHLAENIASGKSFCRKEETTWRCLSCGYIHKGRDAPEKCPACVKPTGYFELLCENY